MLEGKVFVVKLFSVNTLAARSIVIGKVSTLTHKFRNDAMKTASLESKSVLHGTEGPEILGRLGDDIFAEFHHDPTGFLAANGNVKKDFGIGATGGDLRIGGILVFARTATHICKSVMVYEMSSKV